MNNTNLVLQLDKYFYNNISIGLTEQKMRKITAACNTRLVKTGQLWAT